VIHHQTPGDALNAQDVGRFGLVLPRRNRAYRLLSTPIEIAHFLE
jgi:hypothetical protein